MNVILVTTAAGTQPATQVRTYVDGVQRMALLYKGKVTTIDADAVTAIAFGPPPPPTPPPAPAEVPQ